MKVYIDDAIVKVKTHDGHLKNLVKALQKMSDFMAVILHHRGGYKPPPMETTSV